MRKLFLLSCLLTVVLYCAAQKKVEYYSSGKKKFEGEYFPSWKTDALPDYINPINEEEVSQWKRTLGFFNLSADLMPERIYNGKCTFYFEDGRKSHEGNYRMGIKNGKFTYWRRNGSIADERLYVNGMPDGKWMERSSHTGALISAHYRAFTEKELDSLLTIFMSAKPGRNDQTANSFNMEERRKIKSNRNADAAMRIALVKYERDLEAAISELELRTMWDGEFIVDYNNGKKVQGFFDDNRKTGTWKLWSLGGQLDLEAVFEDDRMVSAKDHNPPPRTAGNNSTTGEPTAPRTEPPPPPPDVFKYVEQMPEAPYDVNKYIAENIKMPTDTVINARVHVMFVVQDDGRLTDIAIAGNRRWPASYEQAAINVVRSMPPWKPGRQNGRAVNVYYTLPIVFKAK